MRAEKKVISNLTKCYSIAPLHYHKQDYFLVAAEKTDRCILFDLEGNEIDTVWEQPGGVMSMVQVPGSDGVFLATHRFYSPNDSKEAAIVLVRPPKEDGAEWNVHTLVRLPHVHRFDIVERSGIYYLIACALKSGHEYKDDWTSPGKVYAAVLPEDMEALNEDKPLELKVIKDQMLKNHGYYRIREDNYDTSVISTENGVFRFIPPEKPGGEWTIETLLDTPASDAVLVDMDGDGEKELAVIAPFHGEHILIYKERHGKFECVYSYEKPAEFCHAIYGGPLCGENALVVGHRKGNRDLLKFSYDKAEKTYRCEVIDHDCGPANVWHFVRDGKDVLVSANRETDEVAMYEVIS